MLLRQREDARPGDAVEELEHGRAAGDPGCLLSLLVVVVVAVVVVVVVLLVCVYYDYC